jgi:beta-barrel assembly-enhancing protease
MRPSVSICAIAAGLLAGVPANAAKYDLPTYTPAYEPLTVDERGMWMEADEYERRLKNSPLLVEDEALHSYIRRVLCDTVGEDRCGSVRIYVMELPAFNATMRPNGVMTVWTGLLLRTRSEAELGAVLGHEFSHFELRHTLKGFKNRRTSSDIAAWAAVLGGITNTDTRDLQMSLVGSMFRYNREQEEEADLLGLKYLANSPYPSSAAARTWANIMAEADATAAGRKIKSKHRYTAGFFDTHPTELKRATYLSAAAAEYADGGDARTDGHLAAISGLLPRMLAAQVRLNDFGGSEYLLTARGEMHQLRGNPRDFVSASQFFQQAIEKGLKTPMVHRDLGLALLKAGSSSAAKPELERYLTLVPDAPDAKVIQTLIAQ